MYGGDDYYKGERGMRKHWDALKGAVYRAPRAVIFCLLKHRHFHKRCPSGCTLEEGRCHPSVETIATETGYTARHVRRALAWLEDHHYIATYVLGDAKDPRVTDSRKYFFALMGFTPYVPLGAHAVNRDPIIVSRKYGARNAKWAAAMAERRAKNAADLGDTISPSVGTSCPLPTETMSPSVGTSCPPNLEVESEKNPKGNPPPSTAVAPLASNLSPEKKENPKPLGDMVSPASDEGQAMLAALKSIPDYGEPS